MAKSTIGKAESALAALAQSLGLELVEAALGKEPGGVYLRILIDKEGGLSLSDCEAFHKRCVPIVENVGYDFLECSSPGIDRPLKTERDYIKSAGKRIEVRLYKPSEGQKAFEGELLGITDGVISLKTAQGALEFNIKDIALAKPIINWDEKFAEEQLLEENQSGGQAEGDT